MPGQAISHPNANDSLVENPVANIGGSITDSNNKILEFYKNPFTGEIVEKKVFVKSRIRRSGETVLREDIT